MFKIAEYLLSFISFVISLVALYMLLSFVVRHPYVGTKLISFNQVVSSDGPPRFFYVDGWSVHEGDYRWTDGKVATIAFTLLKPSIDSCLNYSFLFKVVMVK